MKAKRSTRKTQQDMITALPQPIIETILCLLPIEEAARTSILSREWRYKWTTISKLEFNMSMASKWIPERNQQSDLEQESGMANDMLTCKLFYAIHQVLSRKKLAKMKAKRSTRKTQQDMITALPQPIIETILCLLPIEEAARTSILSREWRYKWTTISKLEFNMSMASKWIPERNQQSDLEQESGMANDMLTCKLFYAIHQVLSRKKLAKMKAKRSTRKTQQDMITALPQPIIETILCLLPIEEAARTSILSREWRYKWTTISKLEFNMSMASKWIPERNQQSDLEQESGMANDMLTCKLFYAIHQVLLLHQGPIYEFSLCVKTTLSGFEIDQIILHLSRNHPVKKLTLDLGYDNSSYELPLSLFSLHHLTDLYLESCTIDHDPIFNGFGSLTSLFLEDVTISKITLLHLLSNCPSLTSLSLIMFDEYIDYEELTITELFKCSPLIEHLTVFSFLIRRFAPSLVELPTFIHLRYFCLKEMSFSDPHCELFLLALLIKCSPNLEKIKLEVNLLDGHDDEEANVTSIILKEYSDVWSEHLMELEIVDFRNYKAELELVKIILANSPNLKEVKLLPQLCVDERQQLELLKVLAQAPSASHVVVISVY